MSLHINTISFGINGGQIASRRPDESRDVALNLEVKFDTGQTGEGRSAPEELFGIGQAESARINILRLFVNTLKQFVERGSWRHISRSQANGLRLYASAANWVNTRNPTETGYRLGPYGPSLPSTQKYQHFRECAVPSPSHPPEMAPLTKPLHALHDSPLPPFPTETV